jgi:hypothetical protein
VIVLQALVVFIILLTSPGCGTITTLFCIKRLHLHAKPHFILLQV